MSTPAPTTAPAPQAPSTPAPSTEMNEGAFSAALAAKPGAAVVAPEPAAPAPEPVAKVEPAKEPAAVEPAKEPSAFDDLPSEEVEKPAAPAEEKVVVEQEIDTSNWPKKQREAFAAARVKEKRLTSELTKAQEALKQAQAQFEEAQKTGKPDEATLKELEELRQWRYAQDVKSSPEWKTSVVDPVNKVFDSLKAIAGSVGVDGEALLKATDEVDDFKRSSAIRRLFRAASESAENPVDPEDLQAAIQTAINKANLLPELYAKADELESKAQETWQSLQARTEEQKVQQAKAADAAFLKASEHLLPQMKERWPSLFKDEADARAVEEARIATAPEEQALQAKKAALFKPALRELMAARAKIAEMEKSIAAWKGAKPDVTDSAPAPSAAGDGEMDESRFNDALRRRA